MHPFENRNQSIVSFGNVEREDAPLQIQELTLNKQGQIP
jgi:hypothetical protein